MALADWITAYRKLDEASGNAADSVGSNTWVNNGTVTFWTGKINNGALMWDSSSKYFNCWNTWQINTAEFSFSAWFKTTKTTEQYIFTNMPTTDSDQWLLLGISSSTAQKLAVYSAQKSPAWRHVWATSVCDWNRHHVVVTISSTTINIYLDWNSTPDKTVSSSNSMSTSARYSWIWRRATATTYPWFDWTLDEIGTWNRVLSTAEVAALYNSWNWFQYPFVSWWTNIKSINGLAQASIKSVNWLAKASVLKVNWLT